jgi:hypothetical protein
MAGAVSTAIAAIAIRIILLACFIFLPSKWNWPLGREENKESAQADSELEGNARQTKQRRVCGADHTQNSDGTLRFEALGAIEPSLNPLKDWGRISLVKGQLTGLTPLRNIRMEFAAEALYSLLQAH